MTVPVFTIKRNDLLPPLIANLQNPDGSPFNLTAPGMTIRFGMKPPRESAAPKVAASGRIVNAAAGQVAYDWQLGDTDTTETYLGEFEVTDNTGKRRTFPASGFMSVNVVEDIA